MWKTIKQVPPGLGTNARTTLNKGKLYISSTSPSEVINKYMSQFQKDFFLFLQSRSPEMVAGGRMLLSLMGRSSIDPTAEDGCYYQWELLALALSILVSKVILLKPILWSLCIWLLISVEKRRSQNSIWSDFSIFPKVKASVAYVLFILSRMRLQLLTKILRSFLNK